MATRLISQPRIFQNIRNAVCQRLSRYPGVTVTRAGTLRYFTSTRSILEELVVTVPQVAESITEGEIAEFLKEIGEFVEADEAVVELETDKASSPVPTPKSGTILEFYAEEGDTVAVGDKLFKIKIGEEGSNSGSEAAAAESSSEAVSESSNSSEPSVSDRDPIVVDVPAVAESISEGEVACLEKEIGEFVEQDEAVVTLETDKASAPVNAPEAGIIVEYYAEEGETVQVGAPLFKIQPAAAPQQSASKQEETTSSAAASSTPTPAPTPSATSKSSNAAPSPSPSSPPPADQTERETKVKMSRMRLRTAERLKDSQNTAAMLTTFNEIDMSNIMEFRKQHKDDILKRHDVKLGFMSAFMKASAWALQQEPAVNAFIHPDGKHIVYHDYVNISVAVATPKGLVVPVIRDVQDMSYVDIERAIADMGNKARAGDLAIEDMDGGTFTISNGGVFGSLMGTPIINPPQSAILGMHGIFERPVAVNGKVEIRPMMYIALTYDHRLIDGREAVTFLRKVKQAVEDPRVLVLE